LLGIYSIRACARRRASGSPRLTKIVIKASFAALLGPRRWAEPPDLHLVVGQAAAVLQSVLAHLASKLFLGTRTSLRICVRSEPAVTRRGVVHAVPAQQF